MPKAKSHKGLLKRIKITGRKKVKFSRANRSHLRSPKPASRLLKLRRHAYVKAGDIGRMEAMLHIRLQAIDKPEPDSKKKGCKAGCGCEGQKADAAKA